MRTLTNQNVGAAHVFPADPVVDSPAPSWIAADAILPRGSTNLARGLMSLIGSTWGALGGSRGWQVRVTCPPEAGSLDHQNVSVSATAMWVTVCAILART